MIKAIQGNLHHAKAASAILCKKFAEEDLDVALIQEPWIKLNTVMGLNTAGKLLYSTSGTRPRTCIIFRKNIKFLPIPGLCTDDLVAAYIAFPGEVESKLIVCSAYLPGESNNPAVQLAPLIEYCEEQKAQLIVGCDSNAHHTTWGSTNTNHRGEMLYDFLLTNNLVVVNTGNVPTFVTKSRQEVLDITFCTEPIEDRIRNWHVEKDVSMSDHRHIRFDFALTKIRQNESYRNPRATNWGGYRDHLKESLGTIVKSIRSIEQLESAVGDLETHMKNAFLENCPLKTTKSNRRIPWWNNNLSKLRRESRRLFNRAKINKDWDSYKKALTEFNRELRRAKRTSWRKFCEEIHSTSHLAKIHKILSKMPPSHLGLLKRPDGTFTETAEETLELLAQTHFPGSITCNTCMSPAQLPRKKRPEVEDWRRAALVFKPSRVIWAIDTFRPHKAGGEDEIFPALLQQGKSLILPVMVKIFKASFAWGYIPTAWTRVKVRFIPKAGDRDRSQPKSYRPISLTSFLLKTMEKVINLYIGESYLKIKPLHVKQHAYQKGKSTESALLELTDRLGKALEDKEIALCVFLDIEGAFDNTSTDIILRCMRERNIDSTTLNWIEAMLLNRTAKMTLLDKSIEVAIARGCPQGGVLSPLEWSIVVDCLLTDLNEANFETQGYADDLVVTVIGNCPTTTSSLMQTALEKIERWCKDFKLSINAKKTIIVPFTRRRKLDGLEPPTLFGTTIPFSKEVKYLGVILDQKLTWNSHLNYITQKAKIALGTCKRLAGIHWGLCPKNMFWLYTAVVRPIITYVCVIWHSKTKQKTCRSKLDSLQRLACLIITGAMSTTPTAAMEAVLSLPPLYTHVQMEASMALLRADSIGKHEWHCNSLKELQRSLQCIPPLTMPSDYMVVEYSFIKHFRVRLPEKDEWETSMSFRDGDIVWYTDGSKKDGGSGSGIYGERPRMRLAKSLGKYASVYQAEMYAIIECVHINLYRSYKNKVIYILSDSQAALKALESAEVNSKLTWECIQALNQLGARNTVTLSWVPGHNGINGNEIADELARNGADNPVCGPEPILGLPKSTFRYILHSWAQNQGNLRWLNAPGMKHAKELITGYSHKLTSSVLNMTRNQVRVLVRTLTGHCRLNRQLLVMGLSDTETCRFCLEDDETPIHILCYCEALTRKRSSVLGGYKVTPQDIRELDPKQITRFIKDVGLWEEL